ncbi:Nucleoprotein TPR [Halotydeus destructor]|nr:Nucleoprotein TPR [Halotydeus destructor]
MAAINLASALSENEAKLVPLNLLQKMQSFVDIERHNSPKISALIANSERDNQSLKMKLQMAEDMVDKLRRQLRDSEDNVQDARKVYFQKEIEKESVKVELDVSQRKCGQLLEERSSLISALERRKAELEALEKSNQEALEKLSKTQEANIESNLKNDHLELAKLNVAHRETRLKQESEMHEKRSSALSIEIERLTVDLANTRTDRTAKVCELQSTIELKVDEISRLKEELEHWKRGLAKKDEHLGKLQTRIKQLREEGLQMEEHFQAEIKALNTIMQNQKQAIESEIEKRDQLLETATKLQEMLVTAQKAHEDLEEVLAERCAAFEDKLRFKEERIVALEDEVEKQNAELSTRSKEHVDREMELYFPVAASSNRILRGNASFSQVAEEYPRLVEKCQQQDSEIEMLKQQISQLISEAEENAPMFHSKVMENKNAAETLFRLQNQLASIVGEREQWNEEKDTLLQIQRRLEREIKRLELENRDMCRQVRMLVNSVKEARGMSYSFTTEEDQPDFDQSPANRIISAHLVTFKDIEDLQAQNVQLRSALRELSEKQDEHEKESQFKTDNSALQDQFTEAMKEMEQLQLQRKQQAEQIDMLVKQRDAFEAFVNSCVSSNMSQRSTSASRLQFDSKEVADLQERLEEEKSYLTDFKRSSEKKIAMLETQVDKQKDEILSLKVEKSKSTSISEGLQAQIDTTKDLLEQLKVENDGLREKNMKLVETSKKLDDSVKAAKDEVKSTKDQLSSLKITVDSLTTEKNLLSNSEQRLLVEKEMQLREHQTNKNLAEHMKSLQTYVTKLEGDSSKQSLSKTLIERLESNCKSLQAQLDSLKRENDAVLELERRKVVDMRNQLMEEYNKRAHLEKTLNEISSKLAVAERESSRRANSDKTITELNTKLTATEREMTRLRNLAASASVKTEVKVQPVDDSVVKLRQATEQGTKLQMEVDRLSTELIQAKQQINERDERVKRLLHRIRTKGPDTPVVAQPTASSNPSSGEGDTELRVKLQECEKEIETLKKERADLETQVKDKEDRLRKVAAQAKKAIDEKNERMRELNAKSMDNVKEIVELTDKIKVLEEAKNSALSAVETLTKQHQEDAEKISSLEDSTNSTRLKLLQDQFTARINKLEHELKKKQGQLAESQQMLKTVYKQLHPPASSSVAISSSSEEPAANASLQAPSIPAPVVPVVSAAPVQSVAPTVTVSKPPPAAITGPSSSSKPTPTASIRPLITGPRRLRIGGVRPSPRQSRPISQPDSEEASNSPTPVHSTVATVLPTTQASTPLVVVAPSTSTQSQPVVELQPLPVAVIEEQPLEVAASVEEISTTQSSIIIEEAEAVPETINIAESSAEITEHIEEENLHQEPLPSTSQSVETTVVRLKRSQEDSTDQTEPAKKVKVMSQSEEEEDQAVPNELISADDSSSQHESEMEPEASSPQREREEEITVIDVTSEEESEGEAEGEEDDQEGVTYEQEYVDDEEEDQEDEEEQFEDNEQQDEGEEEEEGEYAEEE